MTIYQLLTQSGIQPTPKMLNELGAMVSAFAKAKGVAKSKVEQREGDKVCMVNNYPDDFVPVVKQIIVNYLEAINETKTGKK